MFTFFFLFFLQIYYVHQNWRIGYLRSTRPSLYNEWNTMKVIKFSLKQALKWAVFLLEHGFYSYLTLPAICVLLVTCLGLFSKGWDLFHLSLFLSRMISIVPFSAHTLPCSTRSSFWSVHCSVWSLLGKALWYHTALVGLQPFTALYLMQQIWNSHTQMNELPWSVMHIKSSQNMFYPCSVKTRHYWNYETKSTEL